MTKRPRLSKTDWLRAGFRGLTEHGPSALKAEPLARALGSTKGSFYWHFSDVSAFQTAMLKHWEQHAYTDIVDALQDEPSVQVRLRKLGQIAANAAPADYGGVAVEPAIRAWGRASSEVSAAVHRVDEKRLAYLESQLGEIGLGNPEFSRIIYAALIGLEDLSSRDGQPVTGPMGTLIDLVLMLE